MNYYHNIYINLNDSLTYFYELTNDNFDYFKIIPVFRISTKTYSDLIQHKCIIDTTTLNINYCTFIITDTSSSTALEINKNGEIISKGTLFLKDELKIIENSNNYINTLINYKIINKNKIDLELNIEKRIKKYLNLELNNIEYDKLKYYYYLYYNKISNNYELMKNKLYNEINNNFNSSIIKIYESIINTYKKNC